KSRLRTRRSRKAYTWPRIKVTQDWRYRLWREARKPLVSFRIRLRFRRTVLPLRARVIVNSPDTNPKRQREVSVPRLRFGLVLCSAHGGDVLLGQLPTVGDRLAQMPLARASLVAVQVALAGLVAFQLPGRGDLEPLLRALVRLHLGHGNTQLSWNPSSKKTVPWKLPGDLEAARSGPDRSTIVGRGGPGGKSAGNASQPFGA